MRILYLPLGRSNFCMDEADKKLSAVTASFTEMNLTVEGPEELLVELEALEGFLSDTLNNDNSTVDVVIVQPITFTDARFIRLVMEKIDAPVLIWSVKEPFTNGGRLCLNSLTGANIYALELFNNRKFEMVHGDPSEAAVLEAVKTKCLALVLANGFSGQKILGLGDVPDGFFFGEVPPEIISSLGLTIVSTSLDQIFEKANLLTREEVTGEIELINKNIEGIDILDPRLEVMAKILHVICQYVSETNALGVATRCWPDFFAQMDVAPCGVVSMLNEIGIPTSCERDVLGAVSMALISKLSGQSTFLGDLVHLDEENNSLTFWHCGAGAPSLASGDVRAGVHPNRKIGITVELVGKPGDVTVVRLGLANGKLRLLLMEGYAIESSQKFLGANIDVVPIGVSAKKWMNEVMKKGFEPHYAVGYGHWLNPIEEWAKTMQIEVIKI